MGKVNNKRFNLNTREINFILNKLGIDNILDIDVAILKRLKENLKSITDKRQQGKITYKIWDVIICVIISNFAEVYDWDDISLFVNEHYKWFRSFLQMTGGVPTGQTYENVLAIVDHKELENILVGFYQDLILTVTKERDLINIDGRTSNGSSRKATSYSEKTKPLNVLNMYSNKYGICLASEKIDDKTNEIPTIKEILARVNIHNCIITWDALNTQTENVKAVIDGKGDYVVPIKGNQGNFYNDLIEYFDEKKQEEIIAGNTKSSYLKYNEKSHSSIIVYEYFQTSDVDWYFDKDKWTGLKSIGMVKKTITKNDVTTVEYRYYISSLNINIIDFSNAIRNHWSVENKLHFHLDFTFREDANTTKNKDALMNLQIINKFTLGILNKVKPYYNNISLKKIRKTITFNFEKNFITMLCYLALC